MVRNVEGMFDFPPDTLSGIVLDKCLTGVGNSSLSPADGLKKFFWTNQIISRATVLGFLASLLA